MLVLLSALSFKFLPAWIPALRKEWVLLVIAFMAITVYRPKILLQGKFLAVWVVYSLVVFLRVSFGSPMYSNYSIAIYELLMLFVVVFLPQIIISSNEQKFIKNLLLFCFISLIFYAVGSYFVLQQFPTNAIRGMHVLIQDEGASAGFDLYKMGLVDYALCHGLPVLIPPLIYVIKNNKVAKAKWLSIVALILIVLLVWMSESTTAQLLSALMIFLGIITKEGKKSSVIVVIVLVLPFILVESLQLFVLDTLGTIFGDESSSAAKIQELQHSITQGEQTGDLQSRYEHYTQSIELFLSSPIWGSSGVQGRHSALLDRLAVLGLLGFIPLILLFIEFFKKVFSFIPNNARLFYIEALIAGMSMLIAKNMWFWSVFFCLFIIMPFLFLYDFDKSAKK